MPSTRETYNAMVTISKALNSGQAQAYHKLEYASSSQNYYQQGDTVQGEWQGRLAGTFGLAGTVSAEEFAFLTEGKHPHTGQQMVKHRQAQEYANADGTTTKAVEHRAGWDATFSAPKSVSLTALVGGDERVREAHRAAVTTALAELERYTQARIGGNHPAETTGKFLAAKFEHDTARPVEGYAAPQLHTHAVIFNVTERADGSTRALQERAFFDSQNFATAVYQSALTYQLRNLGYEIEAGKSGAPEIKGYTQVYLEASSLRSQQIQAHLEKSGRSGPAAAQFAAHATRDGKQLLSPEQVLTAHRELAAEFGDQAAKIVTEARERARTQEHPTETKNRAKEAVSYARSSIFEREAVADERGILRDALRRGMGETSYAEVRAEFDGRQGRGEFRQVPGQKHDTGRSFTTPETIASERANVAYVLRGQGIVEPIATQEQAAAQAASRALLNAAQRGVIEEVLTSRDRIHGLQGLAGTGKTTTLEVIREGAERGGYVVEGFAPSSRAAGQLRDAGVSAGTLQSFLVRGERNQTPEDPANRHLYLLDESSLASTRQIRAFFDKIGPADRVLVIGDTGQHQGVDAGRPFEQLQQAGLRTSQLDTIVRQKDAGLLLAVEQLAKGETVAGIQLLAGQGRVTELRSAQERIVAIAKDYAAKPENTIIVSPDNRSRQEINQAVRVELTANGVLAKDTQSLRTLVHRSDLTGADREWAARYQAGDVLKYTTGSKAHALERGSYATVLSIHARDNTVTVRRADGESVTYDTKRLKGVNAYREVVREFAAGDRIQFTAPDKGLEVANRDLGTITAITASLITVRVDGKIPRVVSFDPAQMKHFDHGYAVTSHSSQGLTAGRVLANIDTESSRSLINTRLAYVAISRASDDARIYTNDAGNLGKRLATDISKTAAVDFKPADPPQHQKEGLREVAEKPTKKEAVPSVELLRQQGRIREYADPNHRLAAVALDYARQPERTVLIAPDRAERYELNTLIRAELREQGKLAQNNRSLPVLIEQTLSNPKRAHNYTPGDRIAFRLGSQIESIPDNSTARVLAVNASKNLLTIETGNGEHVVYSPSLLRKQTAGSTVYREERRDLAVGERIQFTASDKVGGIRSQAFGNIEHIGEKNSLKVRLDGGKTVELDASQAKHIEYGYAVDTAKGTRADRVLFTQETLPQGSKESVFLQTLPRVSRDVAIYVSPSSGTPRTQVEPAAEHNEPVQKQRKPIHIQKENIMSDIGRYKSFNSPQEEQLSKGQENQVPAPAPQQNEGRLPSSLYAAQLSRQTILGDIRDLSQGKDEQDIAIKHMDRNGDRATSLEYGYIKNLSASVRSYPERSAEQHIAAVQPTPEERKKWEPLTKTLDIVEAGNYVWKQESNGIQSYRNERSLSYIHIDSQGQTYDRHAQPVSLDKALDRAEVNQVREAGRLSLSDQYKRAELHYAPLNETLPAKEAERFTWKATTNTIQSYEHVETHRHIHIDDTTLQFYDKNKNPISQSNALEHAQAKSPQIQLQRETIFQGVTNLSKEIDSHSYGISR